MEKVLLFHLKNCPYCHNARRALSELADEDTKYETVDIEWIEENEHPELLGKFDYYYVPSVFYEGNKLYEAHPHEPYDECKAHLKAALDTVLGN